MGWANCGTDSRGRKIGYAISAKCDHPGCKTRIDRGLGYKCGPMHGDNAGLTCEGYFCEAHRVNVEFHPGSFAHSELGEYAMVCARCAAELASDLLNEDALDEAAA